MKAISSRRLVLLLAAAAVSLLIVPRPAYAYLDPGTGSYILQLLVAALFGSLFVLKMYWVRVRGFFAGLFSGASENDDQQD